jgi:hypothetical protein
MEVLKMKKFLDFIEGLINENEFDLSMLKDEYTIHQSMLGYSDTEIFEELEKGCDI